MEKAREFQKNIYFRFIHYAKAFDSVDHSKLLKTLKETGIPDHLTCLLRICMQVRKQQWELDMEQQTGSKLGKEYIRAVYCHPAYLTSMKSILREMQMDEAQSGIKISWRNINNLRYADDTTLCRKWKITEEPLDESERVKKFKRHKSQHSEN